MHTESEAKTKWCPFAVASHTDPRGGFREMDEEDGYKTHPCIASKCMAWRWLPLETKRRWEVEWRGKTEVYFWKPEYRDAKIKELDPPERQGFCGLSGSTTP